MQERVCVKLPFTNVHRDAGGFSPYKCELRLSGNHTVTEYEMSRKPYSQKSGLKIHTNELIFQVMTRGGGSRIVSRI